MTKLSDKRITIDTYDKTARIHSAKFKKYGPRVEDIKRAFSFISNKNPKVVEIGCGDGRDAKEIIKRTNDYLGIDLSKELIKIARREVPGATFKLADFEEYKFPPGIDIIIAFAAILHSDKESVKDILAKAGAALNKGGVFFISSKYGRYARKVIDRGGPKVNYLYTPKEIEKIYPDNLKIAYANIKELRGQKWFDLILQRT